jgi:phosphoglycolate phosphatase
MFPVAAEAVSCQSHCEVQRSLQVSECNALTRILLLDLDGTLVDSVPDLAAALNHVLEARGIATFTIPEVTRMVGDGVRVLVERALAARGHPPDEAVLDAYMAEYEAHPARHTRIYPGVAATLRAMTADGWRMAVCTNKPERAARTLLATLGFHGCFAAVGGGDSFPTRKPDPAHLLATLAQAGGTPDRAVMVGDHANDVHAAAGAHVPSIFAAWGYGTPAMAEGATAIADRFDDVPPLAARLLAQSSTMPG